MPRPRKSRSGGPESTARSPRSTRPRSRPPTSSAARCWRAWGWRAMPIPMPCSSSRSRTWSPRSSTTSTCASTGIAPPGRPRSPGRRRWCWPARQSTTGRPGWNRVTRRRARSRAPGSASPQRRAPRSRGASGSGASTPTTTCSPGSMRRSPRHRARPGGCDRATGSCWSTSSRTPTPSSGPSCAAPSTATPRWC